MITINTLQLNSAATEITVDVETEIANVFTSVKVWNEDNYKDISDFIDLSASLAGGGNTESFTITAADLGVTNIVGIYYVEFASDEVSDNTQLGVVANLTTYEECLLASTLMISDVTCGTCQKDAYFISTLLKALSIAILNGFFEESSKILTQIKDLCSTCANCNSYENTSVVNGANFGTIDNAVILI